MVPMFRRLTQSLRVRATIAVAVAYAFCVVAPNVALAITGASTLHCLTEPMGLSHVHQAAAPAEHVHADGTKHVHGNAHDHAQPATHAHNDGAPQEHSKQDKAQDTNCCGLFCVTALPHDGVAVLPAPPPLALQDAAPQAERTSRNPDRIDEPPIG